MTPPPVTLGLVAIGAFVGGTTRYALTHLARRPRPGLGDAAGTTLVNTLGALLLGALAHLLDRHAIGPTPYALVGVGFCGALTTWSTLARGIAERILDERRLAAGVYLVTNLTLGLLAVALGWALGG